MEKWQVYSLGFLLNLGSFFKGAHLLHLEVLMGVKVFACCSALKVPSSTLSMHMHTHMHAHIIGCQGDILV